MVQLPGNYLSARGAGASYHTDPSIYIATGLLTFSSETIRYRCCLQLVTDSEGMTGVDLQVFAASALAAKEDGSSTSVST